MKEGPRRAAMGHRHLESAGGQDLRRLRLAYQAATLLAERGPPAVIQAWFQSLNLRWPTDPRPDALRVRHQR